MWAIGWPLSTRIAMRWTVSSPPHLSKKISSFFEFQLQSPFEIRVKRQSTLPHLIPNATHRQAHAVTVTEICCHKRFLSSISNLNQFQKSSRILFVIKFGSSHPLPYRGNFSTDISISALRFWPNGNTKAYSFRGAYGCLDMLRRWYSSLIPYTSCLPLLLVTARFLSGELFNMPRRWHNQFYDTSTTVSRHELLFQASLKNL